MLEFDIKKSPTPKIKIEKKKDTDDSRKIKYTKFMDQLTDNDFLKDYFRVNIQNSFMEN